MRLRRRIQLLFLVLGALAVFDLGVDRYLVAERDRYRVNVTQRWEPAREEVANLSMALVDQATAARAFVVTGSAEFRTSHDAGRRAADAALERLALLLAREPAIETQLQRLRDRISAWRQLGPTYEIEAKQAGRDREAAALVATGTSDRLFAETQVEGRDLRLSVIERLRAEEARVGRIERSGSTLRVASVLAALLTVAAGGLLMRRWLSQPLGAMVDAVRDVAAGDLQREIPEVGPPELASLSRDVSAMRRRILEEVDDAERARTSLAERGMIVLRLRDELAPSSIDLPANVRLATRFRPAETLVAGDWYDFLRSGAVVRFVLADVSGHGPEAGIFALKSKEIVRIALAETGSPAEALAWFSRHMEDGTETFVTGVIGDLDTAKGTLTYASAGHPPLLLHAGTETRQLGPTGPIIGLLDGTWQDVTTPFGPGSSLVAYSDGLLEVQDREGRWADLADLQALLEQERQPSVERLVDICLGFHDRFDGREHRDDLTVIALGLTDEARPTPRQRR